MDADELFYPAPSGARGGMGIINRITKTVETAVEQDSAEGQNGSPAHANITCTLVIDRVQAVA